MCQFFADVFKFRTSDGWVQINLVPEAKLTYVPAASQKIVNIIPNVIPIASPIDLIILKSVSCGNRGNKDKDAQDADDIWHMLGTFPGTEYAGYLSQRHLKLLVSSAPTFRSLLPDIEWHHKLL
ncbi:hypothetical protein BDW59DRAFT_165851 [Aspergillus cavernicola]|uniref:Uncharacterized protein n=1 Tax=Aspergillus cavernicola TaxID=176166 RepID=A0ABR4HRD0_9EURO